MNAAKIILFVWMTAVIVVALALPMVPQPTAWYEFPIIPALEDKARIMFFHVPTAWISGLAFLVSMVYGIRYLKTKDPAHDVRSAASAGLGLMFCILATVTGAIWAKFSWGTYWNWDPRQTSIFVLLLIYGAYFSLRSAIEVEEKRATLSAVYSIIAAVVMPFFLFIMPRMLAGLHPGSADDVNAGPVVSSGGMNPTMRVVFYASAAGFIGLYFWMWRVQVRTALCELRQFARHNT